MSDYPSFKHGGETLCVSWRRMILQHVLLLLTHHHKSNSNTNASTRNPNPSPRVTPCTTLTLSVTLIADDWYFARAALKSVRGENKNFPRDKAKIFVVPALLNLYSAGQVGFGVGTRDWHCNETDSSGLDERLCCVYVVL